MKLELQLHEERFGYSGEIGCGWKICPGLCVCVCVSPESSQATTTAISSLAVLLAVLLVVRE